MSPAAGAHAALDWLGNDIPPALRDRMAGALAEVMDADDVTTALGEAAVICLRAALSAGAHRAAALDLLAADALLTHGAGRAAALGDAALESFFTRFGTAGLSATFAAETRS